jgi:membrane protein DedA with SNARE-associated domain
MPLAALSEITDRITEVVGNHGLYAVFVLMMIDAVFPAASELVMLYAGAIASGAIAGQSVSLFGHEFQSGFPAFVAMATAGTLGYLVGSIAGWGAGDYLGRPWLERHGRWVHLNEENLVRAERWFDRWEEWAVFLGRITPVMRSFISIPAGVFRARFGPYVWLTLLGSAIWCFAFAGAGWAAGANWESIDNGFHYVEYVIVGVVVVALAALGWRWARRRRRPADETAHQDFPA